MSGRQIKDAKDLTPGARVTVGDSPEILTVESNSPPGIERGRDAISSELGVAFLRDDAGKLYHVIYVEDDAPRRDLWGTFGDRKIHDVKD